VIITKERVRKEGSRRRWPNNSVFERVEGVGFLHPEENLAGSSSALDKIRFYTGGEKGVLKDLGCREGAVVFYTRPRGRQHFG